MTDEDPTEDIRRTMLACDLPEQVALLTEHHWTSEELARDFEVHSFLAPFVFVTRRSDGVRGALMFTHSPRRYFDWRPE